MPVNGVNKLYCGRLPGVLHGEFVSMGDDVRRLSVAGRLAAQIGRAAERVSAVRVAAKSPKSIVQSLKSQGTKGDEKPLGISAAGKCGFV
jgi:hypothetical protein